jgi:hypothetical protein
MLKKKAQTKNGARSYFIDKQNEGGWSYRNYCEKKGRGRSYRSYGEKSGGGWSYYCEKSGGGTEL